MAIETTTNASTIAKYYQAVPTYYLVALQELGVQEIAGDKSNPRVIEYHSKTTLKATSDEVAWCSAFATWCLEMAGVVSTRSAAAASYLKWGVSVAPERVAVGDVVVLKRTGGNHVGFYVGGRLDAESFRLLSGNSGNRVQVAPYKTADILDVRRVG